MTILVAYDGSPEAQRALLHAAELVGPGGSLSVLNVIEVQAVSSRLETVSAEQRDRQTVLLREAQKNLTGRLIDSTPLAAAGEPVTEIRAAAERTGAEMIVVGRRSGLRRRVLPGSVSARLVRRAPCDVLVVH